MKKQEISDNNDEKIVTIRLQEWSIKYLLGALRLGINAEDWCAQLSMSESGTADTHSGKWIMRIAFIIDEINKQTNISTEEKEYGDYSVLDQVQTMVDEQCRKYQEYWANDPKTIKAQEDFKKRLKESRNTEFEPITYIPHEEPTKQELLEGANLPF